MDQATHPQQSVMGSVGGAASIPYGTPYQLAPLIPSSTHGPIPVPTPPQPPSFPTPSVAYQQVQHFHHHHHQQQLQHFWSKQFEEIEQTTDFKNHSLPLARIKKIMKADEDVRMISAEAPLVFARACEMFILELTLRAWIHTEENKRRTLQKNDIAAAISRTDIFDFLVDIVPRDELKEEELGIPRVPTDSIPFYYFPPPPGAPVAGSGTMMGKPVDQAGAPVYGVQQSQQPLTYTSWPQPLPSQPQQPQEQELSDD